MIRPKMASERCSLKLGQLSQSISSRIVTPDVQGFAFVTMDNDEDAKNAIKNPE